MNATRNATRSLLRAGPQLREGSRGRRPPKQKFRLLKMPSMPTQTPLSLSAVQDGGFFFGKGLFIEDVRTQWGRGVNRFADICGQGGRGGFWNADVLISIFSATENRRLFYSVFGFSGQCEPRIKRTITWFKGAKRTQNKSHDCTFYVTLRCACFL